MAFLSRLEGGWVQRAGWGSLRAEAPGSGNALFTKEDESQARSDKLCVCFSHLVVSDSV